jgi:hypothetical protein
MIAPYYPESVANEVLSTMGGVRFIKWAQDVETLRQALSTE